MRRGGQRLLAAVASWVCMAICHATSNAAVELAPDDAREAASRVLSIADNAGRPFAIVDKRHAHISVFQPDGRLIGRSAALMGIDPGDQSMPDIARRPPARLAPGERITPSGRFESEPGHNDKGEDIVWIDYAASLAIHRLRPAPPGERRAQRLESPTADDNRISLGCIVVPVTFYESIVRPTLGRHRGVVYVLPESGQLQTLVGAD